MSARAVAIVLAALVWAACGRDGVDPAGPMVPAPGPSTGGPASAADTLPESPDTTGPWIKVGIPPAAMVGQTLMTYAHIVGSSYETYWTEFTWTTSDTSIARFRSSGASFVGPGANPPMIDVVGSGNVTFVVSASGVTGWKRMRVLAAEPPLNYELAVDSFAMREVFSEEGKSTGGYVPDLTLTNKGYWPLEVFGVQVSAVGLGALPYCWTHAPVTRDETVGLFQVAYGDYDLEFGGPSGIPGPASIVVYFIDGDGAPAKMTATAPITPGSPPDPHRHDPNFHGWQCGPHWTPTSTPS